MNQAALRPQVNICVRPNDQLTEVWRQPHLSLRVWSCDQHLQGGGLAAGAGPDSNGGDSPDDDGGTFRDQTVGVCVLCEEEINQLISFWTNQ